MSDRRYSLFEVWGIEIEYMVVDRATLDVRPIVDRLLRDGAGAADWVEDVEDGPIGWSNELVSHVVELKCAEPAPSLAGLAARFQASVDRLTSIAAKHDACLMPTGMHPWMDPKRETRIWPHESSAIYNAYHGLYDCHRHGWANLQSVHVNLPFADQDEFAKLMAAVRLVVPLVPALAASSPVVEQRASRRLDTRLAYYRGNAARTPAMAGQVVPEAVFDIAEYREKVLAPIGRELRAIGAPPELASRDWLNARGAIARFDRMAIEIRVTDTQECPRMDLAAVAAIGSLVRALVEERGFSTKLQQAWPSRHLVRLLRRTIRSGPDAPLEDPAFVRLFGLDPGEVRTAGELWRAHVEKHYAGPRECEEPLQVLLREGTLAQRILRALGPDFDRSELEQVYRRLCACLAEGRAFVP